MMQQLDEMSSKLNYIIHLKNETQSRSQTQSSTQAYKCAILLNYLKEIKKSISDVAEKIDDVYDTVQQYENDEHLDYKDLYDNLLKNINKEKQFMNAFGPYMTLWNTFVE